MRISTHISQRMSACVITQTLGHHSEHAVLDSREPAPPASAVAFLQQGLAAAGGGSSTGLIVGITGAVLVPAVAAGTVCILGVIFVLTSVIETKGKSLELITEIFEGKVADSSAGEGMGLVKIVSAVCTLVGTVLILLTAGVL